MKRGFLATLAVLALAACGGGGGGGPTEPPAPVFLMVDGAWEGGWAVGIRPQVSMTLTEVPGTDQVNGQLSSLGYTFLIAGSTTVVGGPSDGTFSWRVDDPSAGCGSWTGDMRVAGAAMAGTSRLSTVGCVDPQVLEGRMDLHRTGGAASVTSVGGAGRGATLAEMAARLQP